MLLSYALSQPFYPLSSTCTICHILLCLWTCIVILLLKISEKYDYVGRLLKPGEQPRDYSDTEDEQTGDKSSEGKKKD